LVCGQRNGLAYRKIKAWPPDLRDFVAIAF
jgi:hypothetical protein